jgi:hypothetical protein
MDDSCEAAIPSGRARKREAFFSAPQPFTKRPVLPVRVIGDRERAKRKIRKRKKQFR